MLEFAAKVYSLLPKDRPDVGVEVLVTAHAKLSQIATLWPTRSSLENFLKLRMFYTVACLSEVDEALKEVGVQTVNADIQKVVIMIARLDGTLGWARWNDCNATGKKLLLAWRSNISKIPGRLFSMAAKSSSPVIHSRLFNAMHVVMQRPGEHSLAAKSCASVTATLYILSMIHDHIDKMYLQIDCSL